MQHPLNEIETFFKDLAKKYATSMKVEGIGNTEMDNSIYAVHITDNLKNTDKPKIYIQCLVHASK